MVNRFWRWARTPGTLGLFYLVLLSAVTLGGTTPGSRVVAPFGKEADLELGERARLVPLTQRFIDEALGERWSEISGSMGDPADSTNARGSDQLSGGEVVEHPLINDDRADAYRVSRLPFTARTNTTGAGRESGEPSCGPQISGGSVWYRYRSPVDERLLADTFSSNYKTALAVYASFDGVLDPQGCDYDAAGDAQVQLSAKARTTYYFQISDIVGGGDLVFHLDRFGAITLESVAPSGKAGSGSSFLGSLSHDARYITFTSWAYNLTAETTRNCPVPRDTWDMYNPCPNVFLRDRLKGRTRLVSITGDGNPGNAESLSAHLSDDGRYVAFSSSASDLVERDTNAVRDIFVRDMITGKTERASLTSSGEQTKPDPSSEPGAFGPGNYRQSNYVLGSGSADPAISGDGRYIAFDSGAPDLDARDANGDRDVFVRDRLSGTTSLACLDHRDRPIPRRSPPRPLAGGCSLEGISRNGRWVVFDTDHRMTADDDDDARDVFVRDLRLGTTERISSAPGRGAPNDDVFANGPVNLRPISEDGRFVVFGSYASNLVAGDTNGAVDIFVRDRVKQRTDRVSITSSGKQGAEVSTSGDPSWSISGNGRYVAFESSLDGLASGDANGAADVFLHDRERKTTIRVSYESPEGTEDLGSWSPRISGDGTSVAFDSQEPHHTKGDVFVYRQDVR